MKTQKHKAQSTEKTQPRRLRKWLPRLLFLIGFFVLSYPIFSQWYYRVESSNQIVDFDSAKDALNLEEIEERMRLARAYNDSLVNVVESDPYIKKEHDSGRKEYARMLEVHEKIGYVEIPVIDCRVPIYAGTAEEVLQKGAGHLEGTSLPIGGNSTHSVITAHTGLPTAKLFTDLNKVKIGDKFYVHNIAEVLAYQVDQILVVPPEDFSELLIVPGHDYCTLLTCTPYMINTHRLLVRGHRIDYVPAVEEGYIVENQASMRYKYLFYGALGVIVLLLLLIRKLRKKRRLAEKRMKELEGEQAANMAAKDPTDRPEDARTEENSGQEASTPNASDRGSGGTA